MLILSEAQLDPAGGTAATVLFYVFALMTGGSAIGVVVSRNIVRMAVALLFTLVGVAGLYFLLAAEFLAAVQLVVYAGGTLILIIFGVMLTTKSPFSRFEPKLGEIVLAVTVAVVLLTALVLAVPVSATAEQVRIARLSPALDTLPPATREKIRYDGKQLWFRQQMTPSDRDVLVASLAAEYDDQNRRLEGEITKAREEETAAVSQGLDDEIARARAAVEAATGRKQSLEQEHAGVTAAVGRLFERSQRFFLADRPLPTGERYPVAFLGQKLLGDYLLPFELASVLLLVVMIGAAYLAKGRRREGRDEGGAARAYSNPELTGELSRQARQWT